MYVPFLLHLKYKGENISMTDKQKQLVEDNMRLVYYLFNKLRKTEFVKINQEDLISEGMIGLIKAAKSFKDDYGTKFATFASRCINNQFLMFIRRNKKLENNISIYTVVKNDSNGNQQLLLETLSDNNSIIDSFIERDMIEKNIASTVKLLKPRDRKIIKLLEKNCNQREISKKLNISQSYVSRLVGIIRKKYKVVKGKSDVA